MSILKRKQPYVYEDAETTSREEKKKRGLLSKKTASPPTEAEPVAAVEPTEITEQHPDSSGADSTQNAEQPETSVKKKNEKKPKKPKAPKKPKDPAKQLQISKRGIIGICSIIAALLVAFVFSPLVTRMANEEMAVIVRAKQDIAKGTLLEAASFTTVSVPARGMPRNAVQAVDEIAGKYAAVDIPAEDIMLTSKAADSIPFPDAYLYELPEGKQAMSIRIKNFEHGLSGKLLRDDIVSVYASLSSGSDDESYLAVAPPELRYVPVLSVTTETGSEYDKQEAAPDKTDELPVTVELLVSDLQAAALAGLNQNGNIHLSLVSRGNPEYMAYLLGLQETALLEMLRSDDSEDSNDETFDEETQSDGVTPAEADVREQQPEQSEQEENANE